MEMIEREQQLKKLADAWSQVRVGKGCIALISSEAGIGKTSLIERFVAGPAADRLRKHLQTQGVTKLPLKSTSPKPEYSESLTP